MLYEMINPSDPYAFEAEPHEAAALAMLLLGPAYGAETENGDDKPRVPVFLFGGAEAWYAAKFGRTAQEGIEALEAEAAAALGSVVLGGFADRRRHDAAVSAIGDPAKRQAFEGEWQGGAASMHSSIVCNGADFAVNGIAGRCHSLARRMKDDIKGRREAMAARASSGGGKP